MTYFEAYLLTRLDPLKSLFSSLSVGLEILLFIFFLAFGLFWIFNIEDNLGGRGDAIVKNLKKILLFFIVPIFCVVSLIKNLIPTTKEMAFIYIAPAIVNNKDVQKTIQKIPELSGLGLEYLTETLKGEIKEVKGEIKETVKDTAKEIKTITQKKDK